MSFDDSAGAVPGGVEFFGDSLVVVGVVVVRRRVENGEAMVCHAESADETFGEERRLSEVFGGSVGDVAVEMFFFGGAAAEGDGESGPVFGEGDEFVVGFGEPGLAAGSASGDDRDLDRVGGGRVDDGADCVAGFVPGGDPAVSFGWNA